ncbi:thioredoxin-like protein, partial [Pterulicium gracile]
DLDEDDDAVFAQLEEEIENEDVSSVREMRMTALRKEMERTTQLSASHYGTYVEISVEKEVMKICAQEPRCVVHFFHHNFKRCEIMDKHLTTLSQKYTSTRFFRVFVENVPWLVHKLSIQMLPCVLSFVGGSTKDRIVGFEELGNTDAFQTAVLELKLTSIG